MQKKAIQLEQDEEDFYPSADFGMRRPLPSFEEVQEENRRQAEELRQVKEELARLRRELESRQGG